MKSYYEILEVSQNASVETINAAFRSLSKKYHPDVCTLNNATQLMQELVIAKDTLTDSNKRAAYDRQLNNNSQQNRQQAYAQYASKPGKTMVELDEDGLEKQWIKYNGESVRVSYYESGNYLFVNFYAKDDDTFNEIKSKIKHKYNFRWKPEVKQWVGPLQKGLKFLEEIGVIDLEDIAW